MAAKKKDLAALEFHLAQALLLAARVRPEIAEGLKAMQNIDPTEGGTDVVGPTDDITPERAKGECEAAFKTIKRHWGKAYPQQGVVLKVLKRVIDGCDPGAPPALPDGLEWPTERYAGSPEFGKWKGIVRFLERVWKPLIAVGVVDRTILKERDAEAAIALRNYLSNNGKRRQMPEGLHVPTKADKIDLELKNGFVAIDDMARLGRAAYRRKLKIRRASLDQKSFT